MLNDTENRLIQSSIESLRIAGLGVMLIAGKYGDKKLDDLAEKILKLQGNVETQYGKMIARTTRRKNAEVVEK